MTRQTAILDTRAAIVSDLDGFLPELRECLVHPGRFSLKEFGRFIAQPPAVRVAVLGVTSSKQTSDGALQAVVSFAVFVVTGDQPSLKRDAGAINIVEAIIQRIALKEWNGYCLSAGNIRAENLYSSEIDNRLKSLWAITWVQPIILGREDEDTGALPSNLYISGGGQEQC